jgi:hypothetical protein
MYGTLWLQRDKPDWELYDAQGALVAIVTAK